MDEQISRARQKLAELRAGAPAPAEPGTSTAAPATAASDDERIRVTAAGRRLTAVELDPRLLRLDADDLAGDLTTVINEALDRARPASPEPQDVPPVDLTAIRARLDAVLAEGQAGMRQATSAIGDAVAQINERAVMRGSFEPPDFDDLFARTRAALAAAGTANGAAEGEAWAVDDRLYAKASSSGRVVRLVWEYGLSAADIADGSRAAVNDALARAETEARRSAAPPAEFTENVRAAQDAGIRELARYVASLQSLMSDIQPR
ncbi:hypothetical protein F8568_014165 [Actinomadura sp. LD22]|uniref:YbaB/EbfC family DNA-binding protein n=1 Tax=Actinomadura physcomitrii TaxID=2650748 RepID=A0A6I4M6U7_9ACTN|nr:hypothetical protein [Actinomadura physcomitrii]MWA01503.1 hypothetical protein [Actinomadura physcomitrii]